MSGAFRLEQLSMSHCITHPCCSWKHSGAACHCAPCPTMAMALCKETAHANVLHICISSHAKKKSPLCAMNKPVFEGFLKAFLSDHCLVFTEDCYFLSKRKQVLRKDLFLQWGEIAAHLTIAWPYFAWPSRPCGQQSCVLSAELCVLSLWAGSSQHPSPASLGTGTSVHTCVYLCLHTGCPHSVMGSRLSSPFTAW